MKSILISFMYVDPGFAGSLYQIVYLFIFGVLVAWVTKPYAWIKNFFSKIFRKK